MDIYANQTAVITGGASGIGEAIAAALAERGARVAVADIAADRAEAVAQRIGGGARGYGCDVTEPAELEALAAAVSKDFGGVNLVIPNAGVVDPGSLLDTDAAAFAWMFDVNVHGVFHTVRAFTPLLVEQARSGETARFVITGSDNCLAVTPVLCSAYTATKHAVLALAETLRRDLQDTGVGVSLLCPGPAATNIWDGRRTRQQRYGGAEAVSDEFAAMASATMAQTAQDPRVTARLCLEGVAAGEFLIITDPKLRASVERRHHEVEAAMDVLDERMASLDLG